MDSLSYIAAAPRARRAVLSVAELALLFRGDEYSEPCPHASLVVAICEQVQPCSPHQLFCVMYGVPEEGPASAELVVELEPEVVKTIDTGYKLWELRERAAA